MVFSSPGKYVNILTLLASSENVKKANIDG
jgi:hypothetical protein